jgi:hypothetical protein
MPGNRTVSSIGHSICSRHARCITVSAPLARRCPISIAKEFSVHVDNHPGSLARICRTLADRGVNIIAFQSIPSHKTVLVCLVTDNAAAAQSVLDQEGIIYTEAEVAQVKLSNRPGELARVADQLGEAHINIKYAYFGVDSGTNAPLVILGISELSHAISILDRTPAATAVT